MSEYHVEDSLTEQVEMTQQMISRLRAKILKMTTTTTSVEKQRCFEAILALGKYEDLIHDVSALIEDAELACTLATLDELKEWSEKVIGASEKMRRESHKFRDVMESFFVHVSA